MEFNDLKAQLVLISDSVNDRINAVLAHGNYIMGPEIAELEKKLADYVDAKHCITCASGTDGLMLALMAQGVGPGDAIFTTPFTFIATAEIIAVLGATPVFVDIEPATFNIDPGKLSEAIKNLKNGKLPTGNCKQALTPKGIIPVDIFGLPADYDAINAIAREVGLFVLEDAAQSFGATYKGKKACGLAPIGVTSFFPAKPLGCYGDGGAIFTNCDSSAECLRSLRVHGKGADKYDNIRIGINGRMDTLQAAILLAKMEIFPDEVKKRKAIAGRYVQALKGAFGVQEEPQGYESVWAQFSIVAEKRDVLMAQLKERGIPTAIYYPKPLHLQKAFEYLGYAAGDLPVSELLSRRIFSVPMHPYLDENAQKSIIPLLKAAF
ncbi:MAG: DegT/DnrJ/EryC1/StrS family aminotransferase [Chitinivibrionales bacterium]|nr:DegT/DnrJ/EryC1/StrS family aminotransferase [Chitinivibrionales bacterium]